MDKYFEKHTTIETIAIIPINDVIKLMSKSLVSLKLC